MSLKGEMPPQRCLEECQDATPRRGRGLGHRAALRTPLTQLSHQQCSAHTVSFYKKQGPHDSLSLPSDAICVPCPDLVLSKWINEDTRKYGIVSTPSGNIYPGAQRQGACRKAGGLVSWGPPLLGQARPCPCPCVPCPHRITAQQPAVPRCALPPEGLEGVPPESYVLPEPVSMVLCRKRVFRDITKVKT